MPYSRPIAASIGPGWVQADLDDEWHLLTDFPLEGASRFDVWHGSVKISRWSLVYSYLFEPPRPCHECDRARRIDRIRQLAGRL